MFMSISAAILKLVPKRFVTEKALIRHSLLSVSSKRNENTSISSDFANLNQEPMHLRHTTQVKG